MRVALLYQPGCPDLNQVKELLRETIQSLGLKILPREIPLTQSTEGGPSPGSPTILIDDLDVEPETASRNASGKRVYLNGTGVPDRQKLRFKIARAAGLKTVLFICTGNAVRSQMAEALVNHFLKGRWAAFSAGFQPTPVHPQVVQALQEIGIEAGRQETKHLDLFNHCAFDLVITLCSEADRMCTFYPAYGNRVALPFQDPVTASVFGFAWKGLFRSLRDEMQQIILPQLESLTPAGANEG